MTCCAIPQKLPDKLTDLIREIEARAGRPISWKKNEEVGGEMHSNLLEGSPTIVYRSFTEEGAAHELLHLRLMLAGFPRLECAENLHITRQVMIMLEGVFHHSVIFPQLKEWGYDPCVAETRGIGSQLDKFKEEDFERASRERELKALYSIVYVRGLIDSNDANLYERINKVFGDERLQASRHLGQNIIHLLDSHDLNNHAEARSALQHAIEILDLNDQIDVL